MLSILKYQKYLQIVNKSESAVYGTTVPQYVERRGCRVWNGLSIGEGKHGVY